MLFNKFFYLIKVIALFVCKLSDMRFVNYFAIFTQLTKVIFPTTSFRGQKLPWYLCASYHAYGAYSTMLFDGSYR